MQAQQQNPQQQQQNPAPVNKYQQYHQAAGKAGTKAVKAIRDDGASFGTVVISIVGLIMVAIAWKVFQFNIKPYLVLMGDKLPEPCKIPIIGWGWDFLNILYYCTGSALFCVGANAFQSAWIAISLDRTAQRKAVRKARQELQHQAADGNAQNAATRKAGRKIARIPFGFIAIAGYLGLAGFIFEAVLNVKAYPPVADANWGEFWTRAGIGDYSLIDWGNVGQMTLSMFSTELVVLSVVMFWGWAASHLFD
jgi:hypothetical protein